MVAPVVWSIVSMILSIVSDANRMNKFAPETINKWLDGLAAVFSRGEPTEDGLRVLKEGIERMVKEGRDPTPAEWDGLKARSDKAHKTIQG